MHNRLKNIKYCIFILNYYFLKYKYFLIIKVTATIDELRRLSGTENKLKTLKDFKRYMLDKAIKEISETLNIDISYRSIKEGRKTIGFEFTLKNKHAISYDKLSNKAKDLIDKTKK